MCFHIHIWRRGMTPGPGFWECPAEVKGCTFLCNTFATTLAYIYIALPVGLWGSVCGIFWSGADSALIVWKME